jgi:hypothetical protein
VVPLDALLDPPLGVLPEPELLAAGAFVTVIVGCGFDAVACPTKKPATVKAAMSPLMALIHAGPISSRRAHPLFRGPLSWPLWLIRGSFHDSII